MKHRYGPKSKSRTYARFGVAGPVERGAVVRFYKFGGWQKGIVLRLHKVDDFARAYGRQADVYDPKTKAVWDVGVGDMEILGYVKKLPKVRT